MSGENSFETNSEQPIIDEVRVKKNFLYSLKEKLMEIHEKICDIADELEKKYPDTAEAPGAREYYLFHIMINSTIDREACPKFDFPGDDSIVKRVDNLYREYKSD